MKPTSDILLIEDDTDLCATIEALIKDEGYSLKTAENGLVGQDLISRENFRLIISDFRVPGRNGLQIAAVARTSQFHSRVPIILISGHIDADVAVRARKLAIVDVLVKPFKFDDLLAKITTYLKKPQRDPIPSLYPDAFMSGLDNFIDDYLGEQVSKTAGEEGWPEQSLFTSQQIFSNDEYTGEVFMTCTREIVQQMAHATFNCEETAQDDKVLMSLANSLHEKMSIYFTSQLKKAGTEVHLSSITTREGEHLLLPDDKGQNLKIDFVDKAENNLTCRFQFVVKPILKSDSD